MLIKKYIYRYMTYIPLRFLVIEVLPNPFVCLITVKVEVVETSYQGGLATAFDLAAFRLSMIAPVKKSVNHSRTVASMRETRWE